MNKITHQQNPREPTSADQMQAYLQAKNFLDFIRSISQATIGFTPDIGNVAESFRRKMLETTSLANAKELLSFVELIDKAEQFVLQTKID